MSTKLGKERHKMTKQNNYLGSLDPDELQAEQEFLENHWANDLLDAPHALIAVIETKIARAVLAERERVVKAMTEVLSDPTSQLAVIKRTEGPF